MLGDAFHELNTQSSILPKTAHLLSWVGTRDPTLVNAKFVTDFVASAAPDCCATA
jgi:hypothetical protein